jgi:hypothetical protein
MLEWMAANGAPLGAFTLAAGDVDVTVAARDLAAGELALAVPENLVVTLDAVLGTESESSLAELLSTGKLSELAILALHLMYEKKRGAESFWAPYIRELDRQGARGAQGAVSAAAPLTCQSKQKTPWKPTHHLPKTAEMKLAGLADPLAAGAGGRAPARLARRGAGARAPRGDREGVRGAGHRLVLG